MAHDIMSLADGTSAFAENNQRESAWHGLGQKVDGAMTATDAIRQAHLDGWNVRTVPTYAQIGDTQVEIADRFATVADIRTTADGDERETRIFDVVGSNYVPIQNERAFDLCDLIVDASGAHYETAGALGDGRKTFLSMRMPEGVSVKGDANDIYLVVQNTHDGSGSLRIITTPVRVVCQNTLTSALRGAQTSWTIRHTKSADQNVSVARQQLSLVFEATNEWATAMNDLAETSVTDKQIADLLNGLYDTTGEDISARAKTMNEAHVGGIMSLWNNSATMTDLDKTAWRAYNAYTEYFDWYATVRDTKNGDEAVARASRSVSDAMTKQRTAFADRLLALV
jgi:phage/plasmid-like protein (TIGR03299 family)